MFAHILNLCNYLCGSWGRVQGVRTAIENSWAIKMHIYTLILVSEEMLSKGREI